METSPLQILFQISTVIHLVLGFICFGSWFEWWKFSKYMSHRYAFYRPRIAGEKHTNSTDTPSPTTLTPSHASNASSTPRRRMLTSAESNASSFMDELTKAYSKTCPLQKSPPGNLLILQTPPQATLGLSSLTQTWMPVRHNLLFPEVNGWFILFIVFFTSCLYQLWFYYCTLKKAPHYFQRPCFARWMEYALTSPLQILLIASSVMIRDVYTVMLLVAAQLVCVLLGFAVECAMAMHKADAENIPVYTAVPQTPVAFKKPDKDESPDTEAGGPTNPHTDTPAEAPKNQQDIPYTRLWFVCFLTSFILHAVVWYILTDQLSNVELETTCYDGSRDWVIPLKTTIYGQLSLFTLFALVPLIQAVMIWWYNKQIDDTFFSGSIAYAILSVTAKTFLGASYIAFVSLFPFETM